MVLPRREAQALRGSDGIVTEEAVAIATLDGQEHPWVLLLEGHDLGEGEGGAVGRWGGDEDA